MKKNTFEHLVELSVKHKGQNKYLPCDISLDVDGKTYNAYEVSIHTRDLLFFTDKGTLNYVVDSYGDRNTVELVSIDDE